MLFSRKPRSFGGTIQRYVLLALALMLLVYTLIIHLFVDRGANLVAQFELETRIGRYERARETDPTVQPPSGYNLTSYWRYEDLPASIRAIITQEDIIPGELLDIDLDINQKPQLAVIDIFLIPDEDVVRDEHGNEFYLLYPKRLKTGELLYLVQAFSQSEETNETLAQWNRMSMMTLIVAAVFFFLFVLILWFVGRKLSRPSIRLADWAQEIGPENAGKDLPDFQYRELNQVAEKLQGSVRRINRFVEREREFLGQASHELRTPVAVIRGNLELLGKLPLGEAETTVIRRIERANKSMQQLIETLLWLSREAEETLEMTGLDLCRLLQTAMADLRYLAEGKQLDVQLDMPTHPVRMTTYETPLYIVIVNLVRNAFQHTPDGTVRIRLSGMQLHVENFITGKDRPAKAYKADGIGLHLVKRICSRCGWAVEITPNASGGMSVLLDLTPAHASAIA